MPQVLLWRENWELGFAFLITGNMGLDFLGLGFRNEKVIGIGIVEHVNIRNLSIFLIGIRILDYFSAGNGEKYLLQHPRKKQSFS